MEKKQKILNTTIRLITEQGFHATPMSQIAREAEVAAGTIYHYFSSKEELIQVIYEQLAEEIDAVIQEVDDPEMTVEQRFYEIWLNVFRYFIGNQEKFLFLEQFNHSPFQQETAGRFHGRLLQNMRDWYQKANTDSVLIDLPENLISALMYSQLSALVHVHIFQEVDLDGTLIEKAMRCSWRSISA